MTKHIIIAHELGDELTFTDRKTGARITGEIRGVRGTVTKRGARVMYYVQTAQGAAWVNAETGDGSLYA